MSGLVNRLSTMNFSSLLSLLSFRCPVNFTTGARTCAVVFPALHSGCEDYLFVLSRDYSTEHRGYTVRCLECVLWMSERPSAAVLIGYPHFNLAGEVGAVLPPAAACSDSIVKRVSRELGE